MYPFPEMEEELESLIGYKHKCFLRLPKEHSQVRMSESDEEKTGFHTEEGVYYFTHMPKELKNSAAMLQRMMDKDSTCLGSVTTWEDLVEKFIQKFYQPYNENEKIEAEEDDDPDDITDIFKIEGNLFDFETPLCKSFSDFNYLLKIDEDLFTFDIQGIGTYEEYELNNPVTRDLEEPWLDKGVPYQLCNHICEPYCFKNGITKWPTCSSDVDGFCNGGELPGMVRVGNMTYFQDHKWDNPTLEPSFCKIRRFEMMKYSFNADEEYIAIKESEYLNHSKDNIDAYRELLHIIDEG
ncbi:hypothetical protein Tco_0874547 [Tanacetum coccineum]|uniref:Uncharacterized protein n=1 Tax=Tanacetum coccineum TaxID=301880 RepID=A0ABQ5BQ15_9ASTR